jgi:hypothetical protein
MRELAIADGPTETVSITTRVGAEGAFRIDLPLAGDLNERLFAIGLWLIERKIPYQARVLMEPARKRLRVSFPKADDAKAFRERFGARLN